MALKFTNAQIRSSQKGVYMLKNERHEEILLILKDKHFASVGYLGDTVHASQPTIRRDLDFLEKQGLVRRSHGGVMLADGKINAPVPFRKGTRIKEKNNICRLAAKLIKPNQSIFTDASTTAFCLSGFIDKDDGLTVITNGLSMCRALSENSIRTFSTGGRLVRESEAFVGRIAEDSVKKFYADIMFFSSSSFDDEGVISDYSEEETSLRKTMKEHSQKTVFLCDSGKFHTRSAFLAFSAHEIDYIVSDLKLSDELVNKCGLSVYMQDDGAIMYKKDN